ncbi:MAG TPA: kelch repeat-containing protein [Polyangia bacterium]|nr:kelch repeat-containing protein [Polyangia bacterium]
MIRLPKPAELVPPALAIAFALATTVSLAEPVSVRHEAPAPALPPNAADGTWQEFNLLQVASFLAIYDQPHDRLLSVAGSPRLENWALSLSGPRAWQPLPAPSERLTIPSTWSATLAPTTGLVYYVVDMSTHLEIHALDPLTGAVTVVPGSDFPSGFVPVYPAIVFDPVNHRLVVQGSNYGFEPEQVWALDLMPSPAWSQWLPSGTPPPLGFGSFLTPTPAVLDPVRRRIVYPVALPADAGNGPLTMWALTLDEPHQWLHFETNGPPDIGIPDSKYFSFNPMVCDPARDRLVTVGGEGDLFALSLETFLWSVTPARNPGPALRVAAGVAIDQARQRLLVCGGIAPPYYSDTYSDAWALALDHAPVWSRLVPDAVRAPPRGVASDGYDAARRRLVVFGGSDPVNIFRNDTWVVDLRKDPAWSPLATRGTPPPPRYWHVSAWDPIREQLLVYGGFNGDPNLLADLWALSFAHGTPSWSQITPAGPAPPSSALSPLVYDSARDRFLLLRGHDGLDFDVWELRLAPSAAWRRLAPVGPAPTARGGHMCVYDPGRDRVLLFGGVDNPHGPLYGLLNDLWALELGNGDGQWQQLRIAPGPSERSGGLLRLDTTHDRLLLFGGYGIDVMNDTWALDLAGTPSWRQLAPAGIPPRGRDGANGAYDATNDRLVVACGQGTNDLWTLTFPDAPPAATPPDRTAWQGFGAARGQIPVPALELSANTAHGRVSFAVQLPSADPATLSLFDVAGRCVWSTPVGDPGAGAHELEISAPPQPPAIYFARLSQGKATRYARIVLMR